MAKNISTGIDKIVNKQKNGPDKQLEELSKQWRHLRNRIDIVLISNNVLKTDAVRQLCAALDTMTQTDRDAHIRLNWGDLYAGKVEPLLHQLDALEREINRIQQEIAAT